ncbi:MAG: type sorting protein, partial [Akkermansiaceae bacterium]|nr:type sorting protein [Akkermansiaceae bacterium]
LYFTTGSSGEIWSQLWKTDGSVAGTASTGGSTVQNSEGLAALGDEVIFVKTSTVAPEIWRSDGTTAGTHLLAPMSAGGFSGEIFTLTSSGGLVYVRRASYFDSVIELWRTDGTAAGTFRVASASGRTPYYMPALSAAGRSSAAFWVEGESNFQLWGSNGTPSGSGLLYTTADKNIVAENNVSSPDALYFLLGSSTFKLWKTDGTPGGTGEVLMDNPGSWGASRKLMLAGPNLYFPLVTAAYGRELFAIATSALKTQGDIYRDAYATWSSTAGLSGEAASPTAVPRNDGVANLLKYAFFLDGTSADNRTLTPGSGVSGLPAISIGNGSNDGNVLRIEFIRRMGGGLTYTPKISATLTAGSFVAMTAQTTTVTPVDTLRERVVIESQLDPTAPAAFAVVEVSGL